MYNKVMKKTKKKLTASEMGLNSWDARVKKYGRKKAIEMLKKASHKGHAVKASKKVIHI